MKTYKLTLFHALCAILMLLVLAVPALAADIFPGELKIQTTEGEMFPPAEDEAWDVYNDALEADGAIPDLTPSQRVVDMAKSYEGFSATAYWDYAHYTIGYGSTLDDAITLYPEVATTKKITEAQAEQLLKNSLTRSASGVNAFCKRNGILLNQNQFDALVDFTYNVGIGWTTYVNEDGTACKLKQMLLDDPATWTAERTKSAFGTWIKAGGQVLEGLVRRRAEEAELFLTPVDGQTEELPGLVFTDVDAGAWYYDYVVKAKELGIMNGYGNGSFGPNDQLTRAQTAQVLANFAGADLTEYKGVTSFTDVAADAWYAPAVSWAYDQGIVNGLGDGTFAPNANVRRDHLCSMLARYLRTRGVTADAAASVFSDDSEIGVSAREDVYFCVSMGIVNGFEDGSFRPLGMATRAQTAKLLTGMHGLVY